MMIMDRQTPTRLFKRGNFLVGRFNAMGCSCEILMDTDDLNLSDDFLHIASCEARRIEEKFSRYIGGNIVHQINTSGGNPVPVDEETARLLDYANRCYELSDGLFDITSGVLRKVWNFDGSHRIPENEALKRCLQFIGWKKVKWKKPYIQLSPGMEIDLGGIGKEYAVDRVRDLLREHSETGVLINFGGDVVMGGRRQDGEPWAVGIEDTDHRNRPVRIVHLKQGALATSGDSKKFVLVNGKRMGHIFNPKSGRPVEGAPGSVTAAAGTCTEAGFFSTVGMLNGKEAESFLKQAGVRHWCA